MVTVRPPHSGLADRAAGLALSAEEAALVRPTYLEFQEGHQGDWRRPRSKVSFPACVGACAFFCARYRCGTMKPKRHEFPQRCVS